MGFNSGFKGLKYTHRPIHQLETCYVQRLTKFDVSATSGSSNLKANRPLSALYWHLLVS